MTTKRRPSRIVYKYVEITQSAPVEEPFRESLAYRAWANCYQPPTVQFDPPSPSPSSRSPASRSSVSSKASSPFTSKSSSRSISSPTSSQGLTPTTKPPLPLAKTRAYSSPAILTRNSIKSPTSTVAQAPSSPFLPKSSSRPVEKSYTTTLTTITTKDGTTVKEHTVVSSHDFRDETGAIDWSGFRSPDWKYPLHKKVKGKVFASYPLPQAW